MAGLKKNFLYQTVYQILCMALPLITSPYISRILGADGLGVYSYTSSIANYFVLFAMLGLNNYGSRSIALAKKDKNDLSKTFCEIYFLQLIVSFISLVVYYIFIFCFIKKDANIFIMQSLLVINCLFDINWFYFGMEKFKITVTRNIVIKIFTLISIFVFIKKQSDLWKYILIMALGTLLSEVVLFKNLKKYVTFKKVEFKHIFSHLKSCLVLFIPILAMSIYHQMDKTMLGILSTYKETGYYYNADKIINIPIGIITGLGIVSLPRMATIISENKMQEYKEVLFKSFSLVMFLCSVIVFGIISISNEFTICFFGKEYSSCIKLVSSLSIVMYFKSWSTIIRNQYLIPFKKDNIYIISVLIGAIVNFIINIILIGKLGAMGAVIGTLIAEGLVSIIQFYYIKDVISIKKLFCKNLIYPLAGIIMFILVRIFSNRINTTLTVSVILEVIIGSIIFMIICLVYWKIKKDTLFYSTIKSIIKK